MLISGGTHIYRPATSYTQPTTIHQDKVTTPATTVPMKKQTNHTQMKPSAHAIKVDVQSPNITKKKISTKEASSSSLSSVKSPALKTKSSIPSVHPVKQEKKPRILSLADSPTDPVDISATANNQQTLITSSPSPPPPIVRVASPLTRSETKSDIESTRNVKHAADQDETTPVLNKRKKTKIDSDEKGTVHLLACA
jgi:hypothetical protein